MERPCSVQTKRLVATSGLVGLTKTRVPWRSISKVSLPAAAMVIGSATSITVRWFRAVCTLVTGCCCARAGATAAIRKATQIFFTVNSFSLTRCARTIMRSRRRWAGTESRSHDYSPLYVAVALWLALEVRRNDLTLLRQRLGSASRNRLAFENSPFDDYFNWGAAIRALRP